MKKLMNVRQAYGEITRKAKAEAKAIREKLLKNKPPGWEEELRIFDIFAQRAKEDFKTITETRRKSRKV